MADFEEAYQKTLGYEGGYKLCFENMTTTYSGINRTFNPCWDGWKYTDQGKTPPKKLIRQFLYLDVWLPLWCHQIDDQMIAWALFDYALTAGKSTAVKDLQQILGVKETGVVGFTSIEMANCMDEVEIRLKYAIKRIRFYLENDSIKRLDLIRRAIDGL